MDKKKWIFMGLIGLVLIFMISYYVLFLKGDDTKDHPVSVELPVLGEEEKQYRGKMEAIDAIKDEREANIPNLYNERLLDSSGNYDPGYFNKEKEREVKRILENARISYSERRDPIAPKEREASKDQKNKDPKTEKNILDGKQMALEQQLFFASRPKEIAIGRGYRNTLMIDVVVDGDQIVSASERLRLRILKDLHLGERTIPNNTLIYGQVKFGENRLFLELDNIMGEPIILEAYDLADGRKGIYIKNSFRAKAEKEVAGELIDDISLPGVPGIRGIKGLFKRTNRRVRVSVHDGYGLVLREKTK